MGIQSSHLIKLLITCCNRTISKVVITNLKGILKFNLFNTNNQLK